jgi:hydroxymethylpyrimidine/phosphomethylpyrimidine kinase
VTLWLFGGIDPTGGAGLLRDFATASACDERLAVRCFATAWTRQGHGQPAEARPVARSELEWALRGAPPARAIKLGLVPDAVAVWLPSALPSGPSIVFDPVMVASDGGDLGATATGVVAMIERATLLTVNRRELRVLAGADALDDPCSDAEHVGGLLRRFAGLQVLVKDGHGPHVHHVEDELWREDGSVVRFRRPRLSGSDPRGTGCALATVIACRLARGADTHTAVEAAIAWLDDARTRAVTTDDGIERLP